MKYWDLSDSFGLYASSFDCLCKPYALTWVTIVSLHLHKPLNAHLPDDEGLFGDHYKPGLANLVKLTFEIVPEHEDLHSYDGHVEIEEAGVYVNAEQGKFLVYCLLIEYHIILLHDLCTFLSLICSWPSVLQEQNGRGRWQPPLPLQERWCQEPPREEEGSLWQHQQPHL